MSEITCTFSVVAEVARGLQVLSDMADTYTSFSVSVGASAGYPAEALAKAAQSVLIDKAVSNIVADVADYKACDEENARMLLRLGG